MKMLGLTNTNNLNAALKDLDQFKLYAALDILNIHLKNYVEQLKPNVDNVRQKLEEYYMLLRESKAALESAGNCEAAEQAKLVEEAHQKIEMSIKKFDEIENSCCMVTKEMGCLK